MGWNDGLAYAEFDMILIYTGYLPYVSVQPVTGLGL